MLAISSSERSFEEKAPQKSPARTMIGRVA
jgi:hypothetical protein